MPNETKVKVAREWVMDRIAYHESFSHPKHAKYVAVLRFALDKNDALKDCREEVPLIDLVCNSEVIGRKDVLTKRLDTLLANAPIEEDAS